MKKSPIRKKKSIRKSLKKKSIRKSPKKKKNQKLKSSLKNSKTRKRGKNERIKFNIPIKSGELKKYGYAAKNTAVSRHSSLEDAIEEYGALSVFRKLNAVATLNKNRSPTNSKKFIADRNWVKRNYLI